MGTYFSTSSVDINMRDPHFQYNYVSELLLFPAEVEFYFVLRGACKPQVTWVVGCEAFGPVCNFLGININVSCWDDLNIYSV